jgi:2-polyprenyl-3-methyl-5-hydroxy-6-metoxy-1,4-benzoquinol methylase
MRINIMSEYDDKVQQQRDKLAAEEWAKGVKSMQAHSLKSMWYDNRPQDTDNGSVMDVSYNDGSIKRTIQSTGETVIMGQQLTGEELVYEYNRHSGK